MKIRKMSQEDIGACARIMTDAPLWQRYGVTQKSAARRFEQGLAANAHILVADVESRVVGFIWYDHLGAFNRSGYVMLIGVNTAERKHGIGRELMAYAEQDIFQLADDCFLLVSDFNIEAQRFYQQLGYRQMGAIPDYVIPGVTELIFYKAGPRR